MCSAKEASAPITFFHTTYPSERKCSIPLRRSDTSSSENRCGSIVWIWSDTFSSFAFVVLVVFIFLSGVEAEEADVSTLFLDEETKEEEEEDDKTEEEDKGIVSQVDNEIGVVIIVTQTLYAYNTL